MNLNNLSVEHHSFLLSIEGVVTISDAALIIKREFELLHQDKKISSYNFIAETFSIDLAREVKSAQESKVLLGEHRLIIIGFQAITVQAQNALLKVLEEPTTDTQIVILSPNQSLILETVRSRCVNIEICLAEEEDSVEKKPFIKKSLPERLEIVKDILDNKIDRSVFFTSLEREISISPKRKKFTDAKLRELLGQSKYYTQNNSPIAKYLLEELALVLPSE